MGSIEISGARRAVSGDPARPVPAFLIAPLTENLEQASWNVTFHLKRC